MRIFATRRLWQEIQWVCLSRMVSISNRGQFCFLFGKILSYISYHIYMLKKKDIKLENEQKGNLLVVNQKGRVWQVTFDMNRNICILKCVKIIIGRRRSTRALFCFLQAYEHVCYYILHTGMGMDATTACPVSLWGQYVYNLEDTTGTSYCSYNSYFDLCTDKHTAFVNVTQCASPAFYTCKFMKTIHVFKAKQEIYSV